MNDNSYRVSHNHSELNFHEITSFNMSTIPRISRLVNNSNGARRVVYDFDKEVLFDSCGVAMILQSLQIFPEVIVRYHSGSSVDRFFDFARNSDIFCSALKKITVEVYKTTTETPESLSSTR